MSCLKGCLNEQHRTKIMNQNVVTDNYYSVQEAELYSERQ